MAEPAPMAAPAVPDIHALRAFLRGWCGADLALDGLEVSYFQADGQGTSRVLCEGPAPRGGTLRLAGRRVERAKGLALEAEINRRHAERTRVAAPPLAPVARYAADLGLLFQIFPADRKLPTLPAALDARAMAPVVERALAERTRGASVADVQVHVVRYKPEQKCLVRYDVSWRAGATPPARVYGRISSAKTFARTSEVLRRVRTAADSLPFEVPEPLALVPGLSLELFSEIPGVVLFTLVPAAEFPERCRKTGRALARFHALPVTLEREWTRAAATERLGGSAAAMACLFPSRARRIETLRRRLAERLASLPAATPAPIHHDFHGDNVLVDGARLGLVDFEDAAMGDPADDVGSHWAQLTWHALRAAPGTASAAGPGRTAFLDAYRAENPAASVESLTVHAALHGLLYAGQCLRHPRDHARYADAEALLAASEGVLDGGLW